MKKVAIYTRVSTRDKKQDVDLQFRDLRKYVEARDLETFKEYPENGVSGSKDRRPELDKLMNDARKRKFDVVLCWRFDRFGRSTRHLITALEEFKNLGIDFISYQENIDTSTPAGKVMFTMLSAFAEFERAILIERVRAGMANAKAKGKRIGRPAAQVDMDELLKLRGQGLSIRQIARNLGIDKTVVCKGLKNYSPIPQGNQAPFSLETTA